MHECAFCGNRFDSTIGPGPDPTYCSISCRDKMENERKKIRRRERSANWKCAHCDGPWIGTRLPGKAFLCSAECRAEYRKIGQKHCPTCHAEFPALGTRRYCSIDCRPERPKRTDKRQDQGHKGRCRRWGLPYESGITREGVAARDGWDCGLCGEVIDSDLKYPHPRSASLDHVIPLSWKYSGHVWNNVQLAHLYCNISSAAQDTTREGVAA